jgi:dihydrofolate reductase
VRVAVAAVFLLTLGGVAFEIAAGGSGRNSPRAASVGTGREVFTGDFETGGTVRSLSLPALGNGGSITYGRFRNEPLVLNFFASWCPFCIHEMPAFQDVYASLGGRVAFLGISQRDEPSASLDLISQTGVTYPAAIDEGGRSYCRTPYRGGLLMRSVTYSMGVSLDGYIVGPDGGFDWTAPDEEVFRFWIDEIREVGVHLLGRRLYETMLYWETADQDPSLGDAELEWAALWKPLPKVVFSTTLSEVQGHARLASGGLAEEIERLRAERGEGDIAIGGATLAAEAAAFGLIDEYRAMVYPVLVGGGIPFFPRRERRVDLELVETRTFSSSVVYLRYRVARQP